MQNYTVLLAYPDYLTGNELETYLAHVEADSPQQAVEAAQQQATDDNTPAANNPDDFMVLATFKGTLTDVTNE